MASPVVSLHAKPKSSAPTEHYVRLSRGEYGGGFVVGYVDGKGVEDFRTQELHRTYDEALTAAQKRAHDVRRPLKDDTGVDADPAPSRPMATKQVSASVSKRSSVAKSFAQLDKELDELPRIVDSFGLPPLSEKLQHVDVAALLKRAALMHRAARTGYLEDHFKDYGDTRDHVVAFTQKTYDQLQAQLRELYSSALIQQAILYGYLEAAFDRIAQLEAAPKAMSYRGVFKAGEQYSRGDVCTWRGSAWHCNEPTTEKPDDGPWQLCVKKGRDGRDILRDRKDAGNAA